MKQLLLGELKKELTYNPDTGTFWRGGKEAGGYRKDGYHQISVLNKRYLTHRLVWMWENAINYDDLPKVIDHIDGNPSNNHVNNLRPCDNNRHNLLNTKSQKGTSKYKGVSRRDVMGKWVASIMVNRKTIHLGSYSEEGDAAMAYNKAASEHFKEFAKLNKIGEDIDRI